MNGRNLKDVIDKLTDNKNEEKIKVEVENFLCIFDEFVVGFFLAFHFDAKSSLRNDVHRKAASETRKNTCKIVS